jgi:hypothetical protein
MARLSIAPLAQGFRLALGTKQTLNFGMRMITIFSLLSASCDRKSVKYSEASTLSELLSSTRVPVVFFDGVIFYGSAVLLKSIPLVDVVKRVPFFLSLAAESGSRRTVSVRAKPRVTRRVSKQLARVLLQPIRLQSSASFRLSLESPLWQVRKLVFIRFHKRS